MSIGPDLTKSASTLLDDDKDGHIYGIKPDTDTCCHSNSSLHHHVSNKDLNIGAFPAAICKVIAVFWIFL